MNNKLKSKWNRKINKDSLVTVKGYMRDGKYVPPHVRTPPDGIKSNNLSSSK